ncbi:MAG: hypothetical protein GY710_03695 [Desulfobacteraceae bacterium]|nr:hypothetical protein [Desulfobacteraceae bacterium]
MKKIGYFFKKGRKKRRKRTFKPGGLFHYQIKADNKLPGFQLTKFRSLSGNLIKDEKQWEKLLKSLKIKSKNHIRIATEGVLVGSIINHGYNKNMAIISDDAGQFNVFLHGLCWVHAERTVHKLIGFTKKHTELG